MKKIYAAILAAALAFSLTACMPAEETTSFQVRNPDFSKSSNVEFDFTALHNDTLEFFGDVRRSPYTFVKELDIDGDNNKKIITVNGVVIEDTDQESCDIFTIALLRHISEAACEQYPYNFEAADSESFGDLYDTYSFEITLIDETDESVVYSYEYEAGEDEIDFNPDIEAYEEEWLEYMEMYIEGAVDLEKAGASALEEDEDADEEEEGEEETKEQ